MIDRDLAPEVLRAAEWYPVVTVTGPRQSGKTTLVKQLFTHLPYVSLEPLDVRAEVREDPRGFLASHLGGVVVDEVQHVPELLPYLQEEVDRAPDPGRFVLTGSQHLPLAQAVAQSLAGRTAVLHLHPLTWPELTRFPNHPRDLWHAVWAGGFPRIWDVGIPPDRWLRDYTTTYVERDVRQVLAVGDLRAFRTFLELCAGRTAAEENLTAIGNDAGVARNTAAGWLSVLEATFLAFRLPAWSPNVRKRAVRAPKLHLADTGLACHLLGVREPDQLRRHPLRGPLFETWVAAEVRKARANRGVTEGLHHFRETRGAEVDLVVTDGADVTLVEAKSGATVASDWFDGLRDVAARFSDATTSLAGVLVYGGDRPHERRGTAVLPWHRLHDRRW
ncbi:MAG: ATP-binding protein [Egibacteraceae bacterium]